MNNTCYTYLGQIYFRTSLFHSAMEQNQQSQTASVGHFLMRETKIEKKMKTLTLHNITLYFK